MTTIIETFALQKACHMKVGLTKMVSKETFKLRIENFNLF